MCISPVRAEWETRFLRNTHLSQFIAAEVAVAICVQVLKQRFHQEALLGGRVLSAVPFLGWLQAGLDRSECLALCGPGDFGLEHR